MTIVAWDIRIIWSIVLCVFIGKDYNNISRFVTGRIISYHISEETYERDNTNSIIAAIGLRG